VACANLDGDSPGPAMSPLLILTEHHGQRSLLLLEGELDVCGTDHLRRAIGDALDPAPKALVADLSALGQPAVRRLLKLTGLDTYLHVSEESADVLLIQAGGPGLAAGRGRQHARSG
jgi:hypothetical protein